MVLEHAIIMVLGHAIIMVLEHAIIMVLEHESQREYISLLWCMSVSHNMSILSESEKWP